MNTTRTTAVAAAIAATVAPVLLLLGVGTITPHLNPPPMLRVGLGGPDTAPAH